MTTIFLSYAHSDDELFAKRLYADLTQAGFDVWFDQVSLPARRLTFHQEIKDAIRQSDRLVCIAGPRAAVSDYVREEWKFALECDKPVIPILRKGDFDSLSGELCLIHCDDFRDDAQYATQFAKLVANLTRPDPPLGKLFNVPNLPPHFVARSEILRRLKDAVRIDLQKPVVITSATSRVGLQGMGGIGKSVLAAAVARDREVRRSYPDGVIWISFGQIKPDDAKRVVTQLMRDVAHHLGDLTLFENITQGQGVLRKLLLKKAVLLVLDDVWKAEDSQPFDVLGPRCRTLVTTRDAGIVHTLNGELYPVDLFTEAEALSLLASAVEKTPDQLPPEASEIVKECGYLPLAIALCGGMAKKRGGDWEKILLRLRRAELEKIGDREAINEQHRSIYRAMQSSVEALTPEEQKRFSELSVFVTDQTVPESAIAMLWAQTGNLDSLDTQDLLIDLSERALIRLDRNDRKADRASESRMFLHDLLYDFAVRIAGDQQVLNQTLLNAYQAQCPGGWHTGHNDGYLFRNLCQHLARARCLDNLYTLLVGSPDWMNTQHAISGSGVSYINDLTLATQTNPDLLTLVKLHAAKEAASARVRHYDRDDLQILVRLGREQEAIAVALSRAGPEEQCDSMIAVWEAKMNKQFDLGLLETTIESANRIQHDYRRATVLEKIATHLAEAGAIQRACELADLIENPLNQSKACKAVAVAMTRIGDKRASLVFTRALEAARQIEDPSEGAASQAAVMTEIAEELIQFKDDQAAGVLDEALEIADRIYVAWKRFAVHEDIATAWAHLGAFDRVFQVALRIKNYNSHDDGFTLRPYWLQEIGKLLTAARMLDMALEIRRWIVDDAADAESRCSALLEIASAFSQIGKEQQATSTFDQALYAAHQIEDDLRRVAALVSVGFAFHQAGDARATDALAEALAITDRLEEFERDYKMSDITKALAKIGDFDNAIEHARRIQDNRYRSEALQEIAVTLVTNGRLSQALALADQTSLGGDDASASETRGLLLAAIASALVSVDKIDAALVVIHYIKLPIWQARPLAQIGLALANIQDERATTMFTRALDALDRKGKPTQQAYELKEMAKLLVDAGDERASQAFDQSRLLAGQIEDDREYSDALKQVAVALAQLGNFGPALEISQEIVDAFQRAKALKEISISLAQAGHFDYALSVANAIRDEMIDGAIISNYGSRAEALCGVASALKTAGQTNTALGVLDLALLAATRIDSVWSWQQAAILEDIAIQFSQAAECDRAAEALFQIQHESPVPRALAAVAVELAKIGDTRSAKILDQALELAERIADPRDRTEALKDVAIVLAKAGIGEPSQIFERAVKSAMKADREEQQSYGVRQVGEAVAQSGNYDWALEIANQVERGWHRTPVLQALFKSLVLAEDQRASSVFARVLEDARLIGTYQGARDGVLRSIIVDLIEVNQRQTALEVFDEMSVDSMSSYRIEASNLIAKSFAESGQFDEAFEKLDLSSVSGLRDRLSAFIHQLASWAQAFEKIQPDLPHKVLCEITRIGGWTSPTWLRIHEILTHDRPMCSDLRNYILALP